MTSGIDFWVAGTVADAERERGLLSLFVSFTQTGHKYQDLASLDTYALFYVLTAQKEGMGISINLPQSERPAQQASQDGCPGGCCGGGG